MKTIPISIACLSLLISCQQRIDNEVNTITVFCAAGLINVITELSDSFSIENDIDIKLNLASSGTLARQIEQGNDPDIYISASNRWANYVDSLGNYTIQKPLYQNKLVLIVPENSIIDSIRFQNTEKLAGLFRGYLSMGDPKHVPAGKYAEHALHFLGWDIDLEKRILPTKDVRSAMMLVEMGECEMGIVYYSDALQSKKVKIAGIFPENTHEPVIFYALLHKNPSDQSARFFQYLSDDSMKYIWLKNGFSPLK